MSGRAANGSDGWTVWVDETADLSAVRMDGSGVRTGTATQPSLDGVGVVGSFGRSSSSSAEPLEMGYFFISPACLLD